MTMFESRMMSHVKGLLASMESQLHAWLNEQNELIHMLTGKLESILDSLSRQAWDHNHITETADVPNKETY